MNSKSTTCKKPVNINGAGVLLIDKDGKVLLQLRTDSNSWGIPGGCVNVGESLQDAAKREVYEETALIVDDLQLFNIYSGEKQHWIYPDGNEVYIINTVFISNSFHGIMKADEVESKELKFFNINNIPTEIIPTNVPILEDLKSRINN
ncbi:NUDIX hydrolase [Inconstantimicrobium mannanitabidum]|uniref:DNA mismatch repair protein MutT n=1 Tax=Inconstantimicrobium mannanitabidum TaxID=1604901 RepID=A0ACB5RGL4_9CLOT|nr:NUDIX domain-containing protein [Clostridium sp. TW13]GKX68235.1 DNA mismatch repair protein MutT [Clostridium sp. TW13]